MASAESTDSGFEKPSQSGVASGRAETSGAEKGSPPDADVYREVARAHLAPEVPRHAPVEFTPKDDVEASARDIGYRVTTRCVDVAVSAVLLVVTAPLLLAIAIIIRLDTPGPALFRHERVGMNRRSRSTPRDPERRKKAGHGKPFKLCKYRTMYQDARERYPELYEYQFTDQALSNVPIKILVGFELDDDSTGHSTKLGAEGSPDPRLTRVGRWLRRTSLDELPNLWNVLLGDMNLVGPRPDIEENARQYLPRHLSKFDVKPGITGLAQVEGRGHLAFHQINDLDIDYVESRSLLLDARILFKTALVVLKGDGAY